MARERTLTAIDLGSATIRVAVAQAGSSLPEMADEHITVLGVAEEPAEGLQKGVVTDVEEAVASLSRALDRAERIAGVPIEHAFVSINGSHIMSQTSRGVIAVSRADGEITGDDVARVINAAQAISLPSNREILHVLPQDFIVDGQERITDPVGMTGVRLEVDTHIIEGSAPFVKNLTKVINQAGVHVEDFVFAPLAAAQSVLDKRQRDLGVAVVDIGAGTTSMAVFEEGRLLHTAVLPLGAGHITNDIAIGLRTDIDVAEAVKRDHGTALADEVKQNESIVIESDSGESSESVSRSEVAAIIKARLEEILNFINKELKDINRAGLLPAGIMFTGGGAELPGVIEVAKSRLRLPARVGRPNGFQGLTDQTGAPAYAVSLGLVLWALEQGSDGRGSRLSLAIPDMGNTVTKIRGWLKTFMP